MKGYEIIINYLMAKIHYDSYQKFGDIREGSQMILDLLGLKERGMQDIDVKLYRKIQGDDFKEDNVGMPFGILNVVNKDDESRQRHEVHYVDMNTNTLYTKVIKPSMYHEYMTELCKNRERFVSPGIYTTESA